MVAFLGAQLRPGIEAVLDLVRFDARLDGCDLVLTGEGRLDTQSVRGKVISGVAKHAKEKSVPVVAITPMRPLRVSPAAGLMPGSTPTSSTPSRVAAWATPSCQA